MAHNVVTLGDERGVEYTVEVDVNGSVTIDGRTMRVLPAHRGEVRVDERTVWVAVKGDERWIFIDGRVHILELVTAGVAIRANTTAPRPRARGKGHRDGALTAPMPATVVKVSVSPGRSDQSGRCTHHPRSHENGAAGARNGRWHRQGGPLSRGRAGAARRRARRACGRRSVT